MSNVDYVDHIFQQWSDVTSWVSLLRHMPTVQDHDSLVRFAFDLFDKDHSGAIEVGAGYNFSKDCMKGNYDLCTGMA